MNDEDDEDDLFQMVNTAIGPVTRKDWTKRREDLLELTVRFLSWQRGKRARVWTPPVPLPCLTRAV